MKQRKTRLAVLLPSLAIAMGIHSAPGAAATCSKSASNDALFITGSCDDPVLNKPYIDVRASGSATDPVTGVTVRYTYVHGGFVGTKVRFAYYFPPANRYKGRFFEATYPLVRQAKASPDCLKLGETSTTVCFVVFALSHGAYVVSSNNAGGVPAGGTLAPYRANAAAAKYSRFIAAQIYGNASRPRGYLCGASGGAYQTLGAAENTSGVWEGFVPMVPGVPNAIPSFQASQLLALRVLRGAFPGIVAAMAPEGSGNPFAGLTAQQRSVLKEVSKLGFPLRGWWQYKTLNGGAYAMVEGTVRAVDPTYVSDFWSKAGYEGRDSSVAALRIRSRTRVASVDDSTRLVLESVPHGAVINADLKVISGASAGRSTVITGVSGHTVTLHGGLDVAAGDAVEIDNSALLALEYISRHEVPTPDEYGWNQYRDSSGRPIYPQRPYLAGPILARGAAGSVPNGHFHGKMIMLASAMDVQAYPWSADWYRRRAEAALGSGFSDHYRLWYMANADHNGEGPAAYEAADAADHIVPYAGELQQALLYLDSWVSRGKAPPPSTSYTIDRYNNVRVTGPAASRGGVQPVATILGPDGKSDETIHVKVDQPLTLTLDAQTPPGTGNMTKVAWDVTGDRGSLPLGDKLPGGPAPSVRVRQTMTFRTAGTYFPVARVTAQPSDETSPYEKVQNLASVRVVVK